LSRSDDKSAEFLELLLPLQRSLETYCRRMLRDRSLVEDVLQSSILAALAKFDRYAQGTNFRAWIFRFVTLELFNRNRKREPVALADELDDYPGPAGLDTRDEDAVTIILEAPEKLMEHFEEQIAEALWQLTTAERSVLLLRAIGEFSYHEIHTILSIPVGSVIGYLSRARKKMRHAIAERVSPRRTEEPQP
jgi:RNA polymerase sigma-70 factor (ECF subfamily)